MQQNDMKFNLKDRCGAEFGRMERKKKNDKRWFLALPGSVCRRQFRNAMMDVLGVKTVVENDYEG